MVTDILISLINILTNLLVFFFGSCIGSFLNVVIYRLPAGISIVRPSSHCPRCKHKLGNTENVPVLGWLWLKGRCRWCKTPISIRYPLVEATTGILFLLVYWHEGLSITTIGYWYLLSNLLTLALIDLDLMILPNPLTQSGLVLGLVFQIAMGWNESQLPGAATHLIIGIMGAVLAIWLFDGIGIMGTLAFGQTAMGGGDPKLAAMIGAWLGWKYLLLTGFLACLIGAIIGGGAMVLGWYKSKQAIPFGPYLALGAVLTVFFGEAILSAYLQLFFPYS